MNVGDFARVKHGKGKPWRIVRINATMGHNEVILYGAPCLPRCRCRDFTTATDAISLPADVCLIGRIAKFCERVAVAEK